MKKGKNWDVKIPVIDVIILIVYVLNSNDHSVYGHLQYLILIISFC